jgi:hypothetical protein
MSEAIRLSPQEIDLERERRLEEIRRAGERGQLPVAGQRPARLSRRLRRRTVITGSLRSNRRLGLGKFRFIFSWAGPPEPRP